MAAIVSNNGCVCSFGVPHTHEEVGEREEVFKDM